MQKRQLISHLLFQLQEQTRELKNKDETKNEGLGMNLSLISGEAEITGQVGEEGMMLTSAATVAG